MDLKHSIFIDIFELLVFVDGVLSVNLGLGKVAHLSADLSQFAVIVMLGKEKRKSFLRKLFAVVVFSYLFALRSQPRYFVIDIVVGFLHLIAQFIG